jgi:hypothetical protein
MAVLRRYDPAHYANRFSFRSPPAEICHPPSRRRNSRAHCVRLRNQCPGEFNCSVDEYPVPHTVTPRIAASGRLKRYALRRSQKFQVWQLFNRERENGVRSRIVHTTSNTSRSTITADPIDGRETP